VLLGYYRERRWIRHIHSDPQWRTLFPYLPNQSGYHKRLKNAEPLLRKAILALALCCPSWFDGLYLVCTGDGMPISWCLANPKIGEREVLAALLDHDHHLIRDGSDPVSRQGVLR
jgi:hypothetical protein